MTPSSSHQKNGVSKRVKKKIDKLLLGVVLGGAVGSILGITFAPKSGKETRKIIGEKGRKMGKDFLGTISDGQKKTMSRQQKFWHMLNRIFFKKKK